MEPKDTPPVGETITPQAPVTTPAVTPVTNAGDSEIERLRKELEQKTLRENQLANQLKAKEEAEAEAKRKTMEEQEEFKNLYEQEKAKREELESTAESDKRRKELDKTKAELLADYSDAVKELAQEVGVDLTDTSEEAKAALKATLDKIDAKVAKDSTVTPNNPGPTAKKVDYTGDELKVALRDEDSFHKLIMDKYPGIANMTTKKR